MSLYIQWKNKKFEIELSHLGPQWPNHVTLGQLAEECSTMTKVPMNRIKLLRSGGRILKFRQESKARKELEKRGSMGERRDLNCLKRIQFQTQISPTRICQGSATGSSHRRFGSMTTQMICHKVRMVRDFQRQNAKPSRAEVSRNLSLVLVPSGSFAAAFFWRI
jgi:hypothetical protein